MADAASAFTAWSARPIEERVAIAKKVAALFAERSADLAQLASKEMGKSVAEGEAEVEFCVDIFNYYADNGPALIEPRGVPGNETAHVEYRALGTIVGVMPWNYPYYQVARFAAPNMIVGNTMILKHAENCPTSAQAIADIMRDAGMPEGAYVNLFATHDQVASMIADPRVHGVSLTGSERAGTAVAAEAGRNLKKVVLELGGSDPYIVLDTPDMDEAVDTAWAFRIENVGQACNSNKRMIVMEDIFDEFVSGLTAKAAAMKPRLDGGSASDEYSPMVSRRGGRGPARAGPGRHRQGRDCSRRWHLGRRARRLLRTDRPHRRHAGHAGVPRGAVRAGGGRLQGDERRRGRALANSVRFGLGGSVWSTDEERAIKVAARLDVGMTNVNTPASEAADMPFGGTKSSGFGRELGPLGIEEFVNKRLFYVQR